MRDAMASLRGTLDLRSTSVAGSLLALGGVLMVALVSPSLWLRGAVLLIVFLLSIVARGDAGVGIRRPVGLRFVFLFALILFLAQTLSIREGQTVIRLGVAITDGGIRAGGAMALRFLLILSASFLFVRVTDPDRLAHALIRWGIPYRYGYAFVLALRFVPFFQNELRTVREAQRLRGIRTSVRSIDGIRRAVRFTFLPVLVSGLVRVDAISMSMKGRAFGVHRSRTRSEPLKWSALDAAAILLSVGLIVLAVVSRRNGWA